MQKQRSIISIDGLEYFDPVLNISLSLTVRGVVVYLCEPDEKLTAAADKVFEKMVCESIKALSKAGCQYESIISEQGRLTELIKRAVNELENMKKYIAAESFFLREIYPAQEDLPRIIKAKKRIANSSTAQDKWICVSCGSEQSGKFCKVCGTDRHGIAKLIDAQPDRKFDIVLLSYKSENKAALINAVMQVRKKGLADAKNTVESAPQVIESAAAPDRAVSIKTELERLGAKIELK